MNLIEHRVEKIYSETIKGDIVTVVIDILCYGVVERKRTRMFLASEWEKIKKKGYYMA